MATALETLANSLSAGQWGILSTTNAPQVLCGTDLVGGTTNNRLDYANTISWDPIHLIAHYIGRDHTDDISGSYHITWDTTTNAWTLGTDFPGPFTHGWDHNAVDPSTGDLYAKVYGLGFGSTAEDLYKLPYGSSWSQINDIPFTRYPQVAMGMCWWSGTITGGASSGALIVNNAGGLESDGFNEILIGKMDTETWFDINNITGGVTGSSSYESVIAYSAVHNCAVFGGGAGGNHFKTWRLNSDRTVTQMPDAPTYMGIQKGNLVCDPVSGNFLLLGNTTGGAAPNLYELNPTGSGAWTTMPTPPASAGNPFNDGSHSFDNVCSISVPNYGVVIFVNAYTGTSAVDVNVYKHAASAPASSGSLALFRR